MQHVNLAIDDKKLNEVTDAFNAAAKYLHDNDGISSKDLRKKAIKNLTNATYKVLSGAIDSGIKTEVPDEMRKRLQNDVFVFSGMKTYAQLKEASLLLRDQAGNVKQFPAFLNDIQKINSTYNVNYLRAEHQYAVATSQAAAQWKEWEKSGDRYNLQFRTAQDDKVRASHALLHNITLPLSDPFWLKYMVPLDWGCRCRVIQVLKSKYEVSKSSDAIKIGESATPEMFRYNPGIQQIIFPPKHPYYKLSKDALNEVKKDIPNPDVSSNTAGVDLNKFIKKDKITPAITKLIIKDYADKFPESFEHGLGDVKILKSRGYMMQHTIRVNMATGDRIGKSNITLSSNTFRNDFNPAKELMEGLLNIKNKKELSFNQEYAFESLWHEILHAKTKSNFTRLSALQTEHMETVNQFVARNTYHKFIEAFGGKASHQQKILDDGYGYSTWVKNFRKKLQENKIDEQKAVEFLQPHLMKDYTTMGKKIKELFGD